MASRRLAHGGWLTAAGSRRLAHGGWLTAAGITAAGSRRLAHGGWHHGGWLTAAGTRRLASRRLAHGGWHTAAGITAAGSRRLAHGGWLTAAGSRRLASRRLASRRLASRRLAHGGWHHGGWHHGGWHTAAGITAAGITAAGTLMLGAMLGQSMPSFWLGLMLILFFGVTLRWMPVSGHVPFIKPLLEGRVDEALLNLPQAIRYLTMPMVAVSVYSISRNSRLIRSAVLEVLRQDYVVTARAKGLSERVVLTRHAIRNALIPIVTVLALQFAFLLNGVIVTETVFSWPGVGRLVFDAVSQRDVPLVLTAVVLLSFLFVGANLIADLMYGFLDPRIRLE